MSNQVYENSSARYDLANVAMVAYQPSVAQTIPDNLNQTVIWDATPVIDRNMDSFIELVGTDTFYARKAGVYCVSCQVKFTGDNVGERHVLLKVPAINLANPTVNASMIPITGVNDVALSVSAVINLNKDETFYVQCYQNSGAPLDLVNTGEALTRILITRIA